MSVTESVAKYCGVSIFAVLNEEAENVIDVINYLMEKSETQPKKPRPESGAASVRNGVRRVEVNEKTATGGWY